MWRRKSREEAPESTAAASGGAGAARAALKHQHTQAALIREQVASMRGSTSSRVRGGGTGKPPAPPLSPRTAAVAAAAATADDDLGNSVLSVSYRQLEAENSALKQQVDGTFVYYINDGVYGSFNNILYDHANPIPRKLLLSDFNAAQPDVDNTFPATIYGPTCDGLDCIAKNVLLPQMTNNDWFFFENMGAYTNVGGSEFNGMPRPQFEYIEE